MTDLPAELNQIYFPLDTRRKALADLLAQHQFVTKCGYYNGHYRKDNSGSHVMDVYPIPVLSVAGLCDIELDFRAASISTKMNRMRAQQYKFEKLAKYKFEAYGVEDYLADYYCAGMTLSDLRQSIAHSEEKEIGCSFFFSPDAGPEEIVSLIHFLADEGFFY